MDMARAVCNQGAQELHEAPNRDAFSTNSVRAFRVSFGKSSMAGSTQVFWSADSTECITLNWDSEPHMWGHLLETLCHLLETLHPLGSLPQPRGNQSLCNGVTAQ